MATTSRLALPYPALTAVPNVPADIQALAVAAEAKMNPFVCTSSTRPASPYVGQEIFETDTVRKFTWTGSTWAWTGGTPALQNAAVITPFWTGTVTYIKIGALVEVEVNIARGSGSATIPAWQSTDFATGLPLPSNSTMTHGVALTNNDNYVGWAFWVDGNGHLQIQSRWEQKTIGVGTWATSNFTYHAAS